MANKKNEVFIKNTKSLILKQKQIVVKLRSATWNGAKQKMAEESLKCILNLVGELEARKLAKEYTEKLRDQVEYIKTQITWFSSENLSTGGKDFCYEETLKDVGWI